MCRIDMSKPKYVIHNNSGIDGGKEEWKLNSKDKKKIVEILNNKKSNIGDQKGKDMWDAIVDEAKDKLNSKENVDFETIRNNMPNYSNL